jgi:hypothetical protein
MLCELGVDIGRRCDSELGGDSGMLCELTKAVGGRHKSGVDSGMLCELGVDLGRHCELGVHIGTRCKLGVDAGTRCKLGVDTGTRCESGGVDIGKLCELEAESVVGLNRSWPCVTSITEEFGVGLRDDDEAESLRFKRRGLASFLNGLLP